MVVVHYKGSTAQFPPDGLSTAPAAAHGICVAKMLDNTQKYYLRFWLSICRTSLRRLRHLELCGIA